MLLSVLLSIIATRKRTSVFWAQSITSLGLLLSTIVSQHNPESALALFHTLVVMYLLFLSVCSSAVVARTIGHPTAAVFLFETLEKIAFIVFALYVWIAAPSYGRQPECNATTKWVFIGAQLSAISAARTLNLCLLGVAAGLTGYSAKAQARLLVWSLVAIFSYEARAAWKLAIEDDSDVEATSAPGSSFGKSRISSQMTLFLLFAVIWVLVIVSVELCIRWNDVLPGDNNWTFGQV